MQAFEEQIKHFIQSNQLIQSGDHVAVAVSGGSDSMALLHFLFEHREKFGITISAVHVDHMLRGYESYEDLLFVESFCRERVIPFKAGQIDAGDESVRTGRGIQEAARSVRYTFFEEAMGELAANKLATAHHADDQIETVFMQLTRGAHSYTGIPVKRPFASGSIIRPFLIVSKEEILSYCKLNMIQYREDPSNQKLNYTRNRFRHNVLPFIKQENKRVHTHVQRFSEERKEDEDFLLTLAQQEMEHLTVWQNEKVTLQISRFIGVPLPLQRRVIQLILNYLYHGKTAFSFLHIQHILQLLQSSAPSTKLNLPAGLIVQKIGEHCLFSFQADDTRKKETEFFLFPGDRINWPAGGVFSIKKEGECPPEAECFQLKSDQLQWPICIRTRLEGDKIQLKGMSGSKKLARLLIDEKIPFAFRDHLPVVTDAAGTVLWVPGIRKSIHEHSGSMLLIYEKE
ncbi:tRNA lysidine(34) synthetase TilS [Domibacillus epiphyticus]|uniref:tRNA(Ile)-lysidine synthase n=1 Tax=Domibacillus epiphyticus TaxID=1714355 RepID=A0A1V2A7J0_9BACI|nr:tRNA lysidine(34) synthetase TilS [Domibacillus epiphyticus]OMP66822.1 tRNA lysidine(34) synthetase TilS [Domibacillus epiphyticus]